MGIWFSELATIAFDAAKIALAYQSSLTSLDEICQNKCALSVNSSCAQPLPPPPGLLRSICPPYQSRGWGICKFCAARGPGICQPRGQPRAFDTHAVSYQNKSTQRILLEKQADFCQGREKLKRFVKACSRFFACISSLLTKPQLHSETWKLSTWIKVFGVIESILPWYYLKNILSYL